MVTHSLSESTRQGNDGDGDGDGGRDGIDEGIDRIVIVMLL